MESNSSGKCGCGHHRVMPIIIIVLGAAFLLANMKVLTWDFVNILWPVLVIIAGIMKLAKGKCKCCQK